MQAAAVALYGAAWLLPVMKDGHRLEDGHVPGVEALTVALSPLWEGFHHALQWPGVASGLSNLFFVGGVGLLWGRAGVAQLVQWGLAAAGALNCFWFVFEAFHRDDFRVGYFAWVASFFLLAVGAGLAALNDPAPRGEAMVPR